MMLTELGGVWKDTVGWRVKQVNRDEFACHRVYNTNRDHIQAV